MLLGDYLLDALLLSEWLLSCDRFSQRFWNGGSRQALRNGDSRTFLRFLYVHIARFRSTLDKFK